MDSFSDEDDELEVEEAEQSLSGANAQDRAEDANEETSSGKLIN